MNTEEFIESVRNRKNKNKPAIINGDIGDDRYLYGAYAYSIGNSDLGRPEVFIVEQYPTPIDVNQRMIKGLKSVSEVQEDDITDVGKGIRNTMMSILNNWDTAALTHKGEYIDNANIYHVTFERAMDYSPERAVLMFPLIFMYNNCDDFEFVYLRAQLVKH